MPPVGQEHLPPLRGAHDDEVGADGGEHATLAAPVRPPRRARACPARPGRRARRRSSPSSAALRRRNASRERASAASEAMASPTNAASPRRRGRCRTAPGTARREQVRPAVHVETVRWIATMAGTEVDPARIPAGDAHPPRGAGQPPDGRPARRARRAAAARRGRVPRRDRRSCAATRSTSRANRATPTARPACSSELVTLLQQGQPLDPSGGRAAPSTWCRPTSARPRCSPQRGLPGAGRARRPAQDLGPEALRRRHPRQRHHLRHRARRHRQDLAGRGLRRAGAAAESRSTASSSPARPSRPASASGSCPAT